MNGHTMIVEWDGYDGPTYTFECNEPAEAICKAQWDCDCEHYAAHGVDENGPWHELTDGYMTDEERKAATPPRHYGFPSNECNQLISITESGEEGYMGGGAVRIPIDLEYSPDDEAYLWQVSS